MQSCFWLYICRVGYWWTFPKQGAFVLQSPSWVYEDPSFLHKTVALIQASWILSLPLALLRESNPKVVQGFELSLCVIMLFAVVPESFLPPQPSLYR